MLGEGIHWDASILKVEKACESVSLDEREIRRVAACRVQ